MYQPGGWLTQPMQQQGYTQGYPIHEAEARSQFKPYSPNDQGGTYSPYGPPHQHQHQHPQFSPSLSQTSDPMQSTTWTNTNNSMNAPIPSQYGHQFARPPQEMEGGYSTPPVGLGVHHIGDSFAPEQPRAELDGRTSSPTQTQTHSRTDGSHA